jgi:secretion/DNA translocation related CpaE-like protein
MTTALVLTDDPDLREEVVRIASAVGVDVSLPAETDAAAALWRRSALVVVGVDAAQSVSESRWSRRPGVLVVGWGPPTNDVFRPSLALGAEAVLELPSASARLAEALADAGEGRVSRAVIVGVIGGSGGAGATTFAAALAQSASAGRRVLLVDTDTLGPGLDALFGTQGTAGARWSELHGSTGRLGGRVMRDALPRIGELPFLTWSGAGRSPTPALVSEVVMAARRANDLVVIDLARSLDPVVAEALSACDLVLVVARPTSDGVSAANRVIAQLPDRSRTRVVVRGRGDAEADWGAPVLLRMRSQRGLDEAVALGLGPGRSVRGPLRRATSTVVEWLQAGAA